MTMHVQPGTVTFRLQPLEQETQDALNDLHMAEMRRWSTPMISFIRACMRRDRTEPGSREREAANEAVQQALQGLSPDDRERLSALVAAAPAV